MLSARQAVAQSKSSRGLLDALWNRRTADGFKPTYNHKPDGNACRIWGTTLVKRVTCMRYAVIYKFQLLMEPQRICI